ncbi:MAG: 23S rRNA (uracil(1939)-C(5))-methyltransferase RlmD [Ignavibacteria bacterium]
MIKKGAEIEVDILELSSEGKGISKLDDGLVIFSEKTLPGDKALIRISKKKSGYAEATLLEIINPSEFRIIPPCVYFGICGGCKIQNYEYSKQIKYKTGVVRNALERIGGFKDLIVPETTECTEIFYYRNKMEFSFSDDEWLTEKDSDNVKQNFALGLHVPKFHSKIVDIRKCFLQSEISGEILNFTREFFKSRNVSVYSTKTQSGFLRFLIIRQSKNTSDLMVNLITYEHDASLMNEFSQDLKIKFPEITTIINSISQRKAQVAVGESEFIMHGPGFIKEDLKTGSGNSYTFKISPQSFFQTNTLQAQKLFKVLVDFAELKKEDNILDLYCGTGSISIMISGLVQTVIGVELVEDSIADARQNAQLNNVTNTEFICSDIKNYLENKNDISGINKLILDPPRSGLHPSICEILSETKFEKILYVSCNPHTQARDLKIICSKNMYSIEKVQPVDMFPHTYHIENVVSLKIMNDF